jgi:hypothetical protein
MRTSKIGKTTLPQTPQKRGGGGGWQACLENKVEKQNGCAHSSATMVPVDDSEARPNVSAVRTKAKARRGQEWWSLEVAEWEKNRPTGKND